MLSINLASSLLILSSVFTNLTFSHVIRHNQNASTNHTEIERRSDDDKDPTIFTWVKNFAAIRDSYTAGIGSGALLGLSWHILQDWWCSRYDQAYPMIINNYLGTNVEKVQFRACSGDRTEQIYEQAKKLEGNIDLLTLTAGGNDLCLVAIIKDCIIFSYHGAKTCDAIVHKAQGNLELIRRHNIKQILLALKDKMAKDGIVVFNSYARFFNTENDKCSSEQDWSFLLWLGSLNPANTPPLPLTIKRRERFNKLTKDLNDLIRDVVEDVQDEVDYTIGFSDWDLWGIEGVKGQMCDPASSGAYPDPDQPDLLFFKPDTRKTIFKFEPAAKRSVEDAEGHGEGRHLDLDAAQLEAVRASILPLDLDENGVDRSVYKSSLWNSPSPRAVTIRKLDPNAPTPPSCPGDDSIVPSVGDFTPDFFGRIFHPNELGHTAIASFAIETAMSLRAKVLGVQPEICEITEEFKCWHKEGRKGYVTANRLDTTYKKFCDEVKAPGEGAVGWRFDKIYDKGTPDEHEFIFEMGDMGKEFSKTECLESFKRIIHGCDGNDPENPMNWKFGGMWKRDQYTYVVDAKRDNRPWPLKKPHGFCEGKWHVIFSSYVLKGAGWSSWDHGQETILPNMKACLGLGIVAWKFKYLDKPDKDGNEWHLTFRAPVLVNNRCFRNNKVAFAAGGFTDGCRGSGLS
ncbi:hypothetical protein AJ79_08926 [Helicocarpus griseus UAMH5409]|uniref:SGNH hydrolase-type esterase domain-containing protein n=1 Tax=Helicocarpus griseus UAMH5409 TaxID=1447875 RepID=A0A2B7WP11_9EURO|nr:hypothetical protein AJ79_08926 [Helicocarpus griseus UAMH5409]